LSHGETYEFETVQIEYSQVFIPCKRQRMKITQTAPRNIDDYIAGVPTDIQKIMQKIRATIRKAAPQAEETISYKMPAFNLNGQYLIYFAAYKKHIGMYPVPTGDAEFRQQIEAYQTGKGTLQFPLDQPIPYKLISRIVKLRAKENMERAQMKRKK
jgi:uncharacterized protein YdhG (YjbR/CyaY superfamily)